MNTSKEFFERLQNDEAFAKEVEEKVKEKMDAGEQDYKKFWIPLAQEFGYELTEEELDERYKAATAEISDEELGKVAGGTSPLLVMTAGALVSISVTGVSGYYTYKWIKD